jgi:hypothetical protein
MIVAKRVDKQLQSEQAPGLRGGYCLETTIISYTCKSIM